MGLSRREFLKSISFLGVAFFLGVPERLDGREAHLTFADVLNFTLRLNNLYKALPPYDIPMDGKHLLEYERMIVCGFRECGFVDDDKYPTSVELSNMLMGNANGDQVVIGRTGCDFSGVTEVDGMYIGSPTKKVEISGDVEDPRSWLFRSRYALGLLAHELSHVAQERICIAHLMDMPDFESGAQVSTVEDLAYLGFGGWQLAQYSFVTFLTHMSMDAIRYLAMKDVGYMPICEWLESYVYLLDDDKKMLDIRKAASVENFFEYGYDPLDRILVAHRNNHDVVSNLPFRHSEVCLRNLGRFLRESSLG